MGQHLAPSIPPRYLQVDWISSDSDQNEGLLGVNRSKIFKRKRQTKTVTQSPGSKGNVQDFSESDSHYDGDETIEWDPLSDICTEDSAVVVNFHNNKPAIQNPSHIIEIHITPDHHATSANAINEQSEFTPKDVVEDSQATVQNDSATEVPFQEPQISVEDLQSIQILHENVLNASSEDALPVNSRSQLFPLDSSEASGDKERTTYVCVRRVVVVRDLVQAFKDESIMYLTIKMKFMNEIAVDDAGVSRDVYTAFWEQFFELCEGESERVPRLTPDFSDQEWRAVGRIWVKGLMDHGIVPVMLAQSFILACIHGLDSVDDDNLIASFLNFISPIEKSVIERALQGSSDQSDEEDLLDIFTRMGSHTLPSKEVMQQAIKTMAQKAILQEAKYVIDCFSTQMSHVKVLLPDKQSVVDLYTSKKASGRKVALLFQPSNAVLSQMEQVTFTYLQRYTKNSDQAKAETLLRFCTGSSVMAVDKIIVSFNKQTGLNRRPVSHTCGAMLELPCTYSSYPDFRTEFDNVLASNCWEMDIV